MATSTPGIVTLPEYPFLAIHNTGITIFDKAKQTEIYSFTIEEIFRWGFKPNLLFYLEVQVPTEEDEDATSTSGSQGGNLTGASVAATASDTDAADRDESQEVDEEEEEDDSFGVRKRRKYTALEKKKIRMLIGGTLEFETTEGVLDKFIIELNIIFAFCCKHYASDLFNQAHESNHHMLL